jgi:hypothetical protein
MKMQKIATRVFIIASVVFGVLGTVIVLVAVDENPGDTFWYKLLFKSFMITIFVILTSFALSVAGKYLGSKNK